jgi:small subunit ribosomal protein S15
MTRKGKSSSVRPVSKSPPIWLEYKPEEVEAFVVRLAKDGNNPSKIGLILRDQYGIPLVKPVTGKSITEIIAEANMTPSIPEDLNNLIQKAERLRKHLDRNRSDVHNRRSYDLVRSRIRRLARYYKNNKIIPMDWEYTPGAVF